MKKKSRRLPSHSALDELERRDISNQIQKIESAAHRLGLHITGHALNNAKNASGWEVAGDIAMAGKAAIGVRAGDDT